MPLKCNNRNHCLWPKLMPIDSVADRHMLKGVMSKRSTLPLR